MFNRLTFARVRATRLALALLTCATLVSPLATVRADANSPAAAAGAHEVRGRLTSTGAPKIVDLETAPVLQNVPNRSINTLHNNISFAAYAAAKLRAAAAMKAASKAIPASKRGFDIPNTLEAFALGAHNVSKAGINESTFGGFPPDGDIAVGRNAALHVVNFGVSTYTKGGTLTKRVSFATFFQNSSDFIFDPRAYWDQYWDRYVVMADGQNGSGPTAQSYFELAVSVTNNPNGAYYIYRFSITGAGDFLDFPQMGADQDSIILSVNDFPAAGGFDAKVLSLSKARMYTGAGTNFTFFGGIGCTVAPPLVLDNNATSYIVTACPNDNKVYLGAMTNTSRATPNLVLWQAIIPVPAYSIPPNAPQPGINYDLETGDNGFEQRSIQLGSSLWNVHTVAVGTATPRWYEFNTAANTLVNDGIWFGSGTSSDWHPSIVANLFGEVFGTWMSVDASANKNLSLHYISGSGNSAGTGPGNTLVTSTQPLTGQTFPAGRNRAGDYSYIALDPTAYGACAETRRTWLEGEVTFAANAWGTWIGEVGNC